MGAYTQRGILVQGQVDIVVINMHGTPTSVTNVNTDSLINKSIDTLVLLACNAGHQDFKYSNPAYRLFQKGVRQLVACDGTHHRGLGTSISIKANDTWKADVVNKKRKSQGFVKYHTARSREGKSIVKVDSIGKKFNSVSKLLKKVGKW